MKRKTNLFYTSGPDSKFLTFSNYTEALTGNFLSINTKLFPDKFLCLQINGLNAISKERFIKYLVSYYENKLAVLRDAAITKNNTIETNIYPLSYLLEALINVTEYDESTKEYNLNFNKSDKTINDNIKNFIKYIGDVTEYDYNGTYTDTICSINGNSYNVGILKVDDNINQVINSYTINNVNTLYGWENDNLIFSEYQNCTPIFDKTSLGSGTYQNNPIFTKIEIKNIDELDNTYNKSLKFNVIIPLFSFINIDYESNTNILDPIQDENGVKYLKLNDTNNAIYDVPLGIWLYADKDEDTFIELIKDEDYNVYPTWSLLISSQFKPFPYSNSINKDIKLSSKLNEFSTFAEVLTKINNVLDQFTSINNQLNSLSQKINKLESNIKEISTEENINNLHTRINTLSSDTNNKFEEINKKLVNIKWSLS